MLQYLFIIIGIELFLSGKLQYFPFFHQLWENLFPKRACSANLWTVHQAKLVLELSNSLCLSWFLSLLMCRPMGTFALPTSYFLLRLSFIVIAKYDKILFK